VPPAPVCAWLASWRLAWSSLAGFLAACGLVLAEMAHADLADIPAGLDQTREWLANQAAALR